MRLLKHAQQRLLRVHQDEPLGRRLDHLGPGPGPKGRDAAVPVDLSHGLEGARAPVAAQVGLPDLFFFF